MIDPPALEMWRTLFPTWPSFKSKTRPRAASASKTVMRRGLFFLKNDKTDLQNAPD
ncbi:MAG: hypothetical protein ACO27F_08155 [Beijerinckiaceae bacterium]